MWHRGLIYKLKNLGCSERLLKWFSSYLSDRRQRVVINGQASGWTYIKEGVPQGSILGSLLFLIYINDIVNELHASARLFADDTSLYIIVDTPARFSIRFTASAFRKLLSIYVFSYFPFGFVGRMWDLIVSIPDHCLSFYSAALIMNNDLSYITSWAADWLVDFNASKTLSMLMSRKRNPGHHPPPYMNDTMVLDTKSHKHLGLTFSNTFDWNEQIKKTTA